MGSTFLGLEIGTRSLLRHQKGLGVIGHNMANADNENYSRQRVDAKTIQPLYAPSLNREERAGQIGQGCEIASIRRERDMYLDVRISNELSHAEYWKTRRTMLHEIENINSALGDVSLQTRLDDFWKGWQELSLHPTEPAVRESLLEKSVNLTRGFNTEFENLSSLRNEIETKVQSALKTINGITASIAHLNLEIQQVHNVGDDPNDLLDRRDALVEELSGWINVRTEYKDNDEVMVFVGGKKLVQGGKVSQLEGVTSAEKKGMTEIRWKTDGSAFDAGGGKLKAMTEVRDEHIPAQIRSLDSLAISVMDSVNEIHSQGFNLYSKKAPVFFTMRTRGTDPSGDFDRLGNGRADSTLLYRITGSQQMDSDSVSGDNGVMTFKSGDDTYTVGYSSDMTVGQIIEKINLENPNINAYLNMDNRLVLRATSLDETGSFEIRYISDSGSFLTGISGILAASGPAGAFDSSVPGQAAVLSAQGTSFELSPAQHPSGWWSVNSAIRSDSGLIAAAGGTDYLGKDGRDTSDGIGDGKIALAIAEIRNGNLRIDNSRTIDDYYARMIDYSATRANISDIETKKHESALANLKSIRQQISGVNLDEEVSQMLAMQHGYQAAARVVSAVDKMLDTIINRMGA